MNILFLIRSLNSGGAERQLVNVAVGLKTKGHKVSVAIFYSGGFLQDDLDAAGVPVITLDKKSRWDIFSFSFSLRRVVKDVNPDIIHGYTGVPNGLALLSKFFHPSSKVVWGVRASNIDLSEYDLLARVLYKLECFLSKFADLIISNSKSGADYALSNGFPNEKMEIVYNGINTQVFKPDNEERLRVRRLLNIADDEILIGRVGRIDPMKGYPTFIKAMEKLVAANNKIFALSMGNGEEEYANHLRREVADSKLSDNFFWKVARDDVASYMNAFDILVSSSEFGEGFPNVIGEAMACGIPCVVTDVGDSAFVVGECGIVVLPHDSMILAQAVESMLAKLLHSENGLASCARARIVENFTIDKLVDKTEACLHAVKST